MQDKLRNGTAEPIFTGRYGQGHFDVIEHGCDFFVVKFDKGNVGQRGGLVDLENDSGLYIFRAEDMPEMVGSQIVGFGDGWTDHIIVRAYNAEDAARNWWGAICQWHVWFNYKDMDWRTAPFTNEVGEFPADGGDHGGIGFDAYPPDDTAKDGITRPDLFGDGMRWIVKDGVELRELVAA